MMMRLEVATGGIMSLRNGLHVRDLNDGQDLHDNLGYFVSIMG